jgi:hypothetical protein
MDASTRSYVQAGFDRDYARTRVRCLEHRERYAPPEDEMSFSLFSDCLADFRTRAVVDAADALLTDQNTPLDDASLVTALSDAELTDLAFRLPLLGRVADERFGYVGLAGGHGLVNLVEWRLATEAYLALLAEWPEHARAVRAGDLQAMRAVGIGLQGALRSISDPGRGGPGLIDRVMAYYETRLRVLTVEGAALALRHRQQTLLRIDPASVLVSVEDSSGRGPTLEVPEVVAAEVPAVLRTAVALGLDEAALVYRLSSEDTVVRSGSRHSFLFFGRRHDRFTYTRTTVDVELRSMTHGVIGRFSSTGPYVLRSTEEMNGDERSDEVRERVDHVTDPDAYFLESVWPHLAADAVEWRTHPVRDGVTLDLEGRVETALRGHATAGLDNVFASVCSDAPGGEVLAAEDRASANRIRSALTGMSAARALLEAYLRLATPEGSGSVPELHAALSGPDGVLDRGRLCSVVATGESPLRLVWLEEEPRERLAQLRSAVTAVMASPTTSGMTLVDPVLARIELAIRVQGLRVAFAER